MSSATTSTIFGRRSSDTAEAIANAGSRRRKLTTEDTERTERKKRFGMGFLDRMTGFTGRL
jgi:hypothetical protein